MAEPPIAFDQVMNVGVNKPPPVEPTRDAAMILEQAKPLAIAFADFFAPFSEHGKTETSAHPAGVGREVPSNPSPEKQDPAVWVRLLLPMK